MRLGSRFGTLVTGCVLAAACSSPTNSGMDASTSDATAADVLERTATLTGTSGTARFRLSAGAGNATLEIDAGSTQIRARSFLWIGVRPGGVSPTVFHDPRRENPAGITWVRGAASATLESADTLVLEDPAFGTVRVRLLTPEAGAFALAVEAAPANVAMLRFALDADDGAYHGLGERHEAPDARGQVVAMQFMGGGTRSGTNELHVPVPFFVNTHGYGMFVETRESGAFDVAATDATRVAASFEGTRATVHFFVNGDPTEVIAAYTRRTGLPRLPPRWAFAPQQWRNEWPSDAVMLEDARRLRSEHLPTTTIWIDNPWQVSYNDSTIDRTRFRDPEALMSTLRSLGYKVIFWSVPYLDAVTGGAQPRNPAETLWTMAQQQGWLVRDGSGAPFISPTGFGSPGGMPDALGSLIDFTSPAASEFWTQRLAAPIALGGRGFKLDYGEDLLPELAGARSRFLFASGATSREVHNTYPQLYHRAYRAALDRFAGGDGFLLVRASSWGGQSVCDVVWPGDLDSDFRTSDGGEVGGLPSAISSMVSLAASGFPSFASDTGGFRGFPTKQSLVRWAEHTALSPFMQLGGGGSSHNPWEFDPETVSLYRGLAQLHQDLVPFLHGLVARASEDGTPPVRSVALAFPADTAARADRYAYLLGDDVLVAPVVTAGAVVRRVHFPAGTWIHGTDGTVFTGPTDADVPAPLGHPAWFVRRGAIVPMGARDVESLAEASDTSVVDEGDRAGQRRARVFPAAVARSVSFEGATVAFDGTASGSLRFTFRPGGAVGSLDAELDIGHSGLSLAPVTVVTIGGAVMARAADSDAADRCPRCWDYDPGRGVLRIRLNVQGELTIR